MPFTPFHLGPALLIGLIFFPLLYLPAVLLGSIIVDVEPLSFLILGLPVLHLFFHTFLGATILALILALVVFLLQELLGNIMAIFRLPQKASPLNITFAVLIGAYSHVILDAFLYSEIQPFWPLLGNPFLGLVSSSMVYLFCIICFIVAIPFYIFQIWRRKRQQKKMII